MSEILIGVIVVGLCIYGIAFKIYSNRDHWSGTENLKANAKIKDIKHVNLNNYIKTVVFFDDGFTYTSFKTRTSGTYKHRVLTVDSLVNDEIVKLAMSKHDVLLAEKSK